MTGAEAALPAARAALVAALCQHAETRPDAIAIRESSRSGARRALGWRALVDAIAGLAHDLSRDGRAPVLLVSAPNCLEQMVAVLAGLACGGTVVSLPPDLPALRLREVARRTQATFAIAGEDAQSPLAEEGIRATPLGAIALERGARSASTQSLERGGAGSSLVLLTSGTSGAPKLVRRTVAALDAVGQGCSRAMGLGPDDAMLLAIPLHHSFGIDQGLLAALTAGSRIELHAGFAPQRMLSALRDDGITTLPLVPYLFDVLARSARLGPRPAPALRRAISAGSMLPRAVAEEFRARFHVAISQLYGATEFGSVTYADAGALDFREGTVGRPLPGVAIRVLDATAPDPRRPVARGEEGVVAVASASMFQGYLGETASPFVDGFFLAGDIGRFDEGDRLLLTGRLALLIDVGGRKVNPLEVESVLEAHPAVHAAAVVPVPYSRTVSRLKAIIVPDPTRSPGVAELRSYLRERIDDYKIPRSFELREALPRSPTGKLLRQQLSS